MDQELLQYFYASKVRMPSNRISLLDLEWTAWPSNLLILPSTMGILLALRSWVIEKQNDQVKHYVSSSLFHLCFGVFHKFLNKTQSSFLYNPFKSLNMWYLWVLTKALKELCLLSSQHMWYFWLKANLSYAFSYSPYTSKFMWSSWEMAHTYLQCICCLVKLWIQRN
jgi:hypothetical protein